MKTTFILSAAALVRLAFALPQYQPYDEVEDLEERDDECGAPEPVTTAVPHRGFSHTHHHHHHSTVTVDATPSASSAPVEPTTTVVAVSSPAGPSSAPASVAASSVVSSASSVPSSSGKTGSGGNPYIPSGIKAGLSGYIGIAANDPDAFNALAPYIGWYSDYGPATPDVGDVVGVPMVRLLE